MITSVLSTKYDPLIMTRYFYSQELAIFSQNPKQTKVKTSSFNLGYNKHFRIKKNYYRSDALSQ